MTEWGHRPHSFEVMLSISWAHWAFHSPRSVQPQLSLVHVTDFPKLSEHLLRHRLPRIFEVNWTAIAFLMAASCTAWSFILAYLLSRAVGSSTLCLLVWVVFVLGWGWLCSNASWWAWRRFWTEFLILVLGSSTSWQTPGCFDSLAEDLLLSGGWSVERLAWCDWKVDMSRRRIARSGCIVSFAIWKNIYKATVHQYQLYLWIFAVLFYSSFNLHSALWFRRCMELADASRQPHRHRECLLPRTWQPKT